MKKVNRGRAPGAVHSLPLARRDDEGCFFGSGLRAVLRHFGSAEVIREEMQVLSWHTPSGSSR